MPPIQFELTLTAHAYGGAAVGRLPDGRAAFVPFGLPGERVRIEMVEEKERLVRGRLVSVLEGAPGRVTPRCKHYGTCGGCHYQHMSYPQQLIAKAEILDDQLRRIGRIENPPVAATVGGEPWNYRNYLQFQLAADGKLGFVRHRDGPNPSDIMPMEECHLPLDAINALWPQLAFEGESGIDRVGMRAGREEDLMVILESGSPAVPELEIEAPVSIVHVFEGDAVVQAGEPYVVEEVLGRAFRVSPTSFFQVNAPVAEKMVAHVRDALPNKARMLMDVYAGVGLFSAFLAPRCDRLIAIEASAAACEDFMANLDEFDNVELYEDAAGRALPSLTLEPEAVVLDPPRAGVEIPAMDALVKMAPGLIIYVSCDPATLARDAARLIRGGYHLDSVTPFDMFPQTYHIESVSVFRR